MFMNFGPREAKRGVSAPSTDASALSDPVSARSRLAQRSLPGPARPPGRSLFADGLGPVSAERPLNAADRHVIEASMGSARITAVCADCRVGETDQFDFDIPTYSVGCTHLPL
jgi:hypothetical protein